MRVDMLATLRDEGNRSVRWGCEAPALVRNGGGVQECKIQLMKRGQECTFEGGRNQECRVRGWQECKCPPVEQAEKIVAVSARDRRGNTRENG